MTMNEFESANYKYLDTCVKNLRKLKPVAFLDVATYFWAPFFLVVSYMTRTT